jgi:hypothetical protein
LPKQWIVDLMVFGILGARQHYSFSGPDRGTMTREEFSKLNDDDAKAYPITELRAIFSAEASANRGLEDAIAGVRLPNIAEQMLKRFDK